MSNMVVRTNIFALNAHRNMKNVGMQQRQASNRLSSGFRINSAADDAAGLAISENMRAQIRGLDQASRNTQDGQAMLLTTEGGLEEIGNMLQRTRELMVQASNDTNTQDQRGLIEQEIAQLGREITSMQNRVEFNTNRVLNMGPAMTTSVIANATKMAGSAQNLGIWSNMYSELLTRTQAAIDIFSELNPAHANPGAGSAAAVALTNTGGLTVAAFGTPVTNADSHFAAVVVPTNLNVTAAAVAAGTDIGHTLRNLNARMVEITTAMHTLSTSTTAGAGLLRAQFNTQQADVRTFVNAPSSANNVAFFQVGANASQGINFDFETVSRAVSAAGTTVSMLASVMSAPSSGSGIGNGVRISPYLSALDDSIDDISRTRANLGAVQNRMDYTMRSLDISSENLQDSESRVRNADIAREMMRSTMSNVLQQAAVSMLSQANQMPQNLLQLLR